MSFQIRDGCHPRGYNPLRPGLKPHPLQLFQIALRTFGGIVGQKNIGFSGILHRLQKVPCALNPLFPQINGSVHIKGKTAAFFEKPLFICVSFRYHNISSQTALVASLSHASSSPSK